MLGDLIFSRSSAAAARLGPLAPDHHRFRDKYVLLTGEEKTLATANGQECFLNSLRLLVRICSNVEVAFPRVDQQFEAECRSVAEHITFGNPIKIVNDAPDFPVYDAVLSIGTVARPELPWTVINSNGWLARVSSGRTHLPAKCDQFNPIAALAAASLGVADVFKRLIHLKESRGRLQNGLAFSLLSLNCDEDNPGPELPTELVLHLLLVGAGAIGNGVIHLVHRLPISGRVWIVDGQVFQEENLGTCLLIGPEDLGNAKSTFAEALLCKKMNAKGFHENLSAFENRLGTEVPYPPVVIAALDNIDARHETQKLWPDLIIDGAIGDFGCQVSRHHWGDESACLICQFRHPDGRSSVLLACEATGLTAARVNQGDNLVTEEDVCVASAARQEWLRDRIGRPICSVVSEGVLLKLSESRQEKGFAPSVPFVACLSASMVIAELIKFVSGWKTVLETRFQFDALRGPASGLMVPQDKRRDCACGARAHTIATWRQSRAEF